MIDAADLSWRAATRFGPLLLEAQIGDGMLLRQQLAPRTVPFPIHSAPLPAAIWVLPRIFRRSKAELMGVGIGHAHCWSDRRGHWVATPAGGSGLSLDSSACKRLATVAMGISVSTSRGE